MHVLSFEKPIADLMTRMQELKGLESSHGDDKKLRIEILRLEERTKTLVKTLYGALTPWQKVLLSRHPNRPYSLDYIGLIFTDFVELAGDRRYGEDASIISGLAKFRGRSVAIVAHQKGRGAKDNLKRNFGMPNPEGYRKAVRIFELADRFSLPIFTLIDTPGAYPGIGAEERGQSEAIGSCLAALGRVSVPVIAAIIGEGGSGGALALAVANYIYVLEYGTYSVITPEGCAAILWKDGSKADVAASRMRMTAPDLLRFGVVDDIVNEPPGGAHYDVKLAAENLAGALELGLAKLKNVPDLREHRYKRFRAFGAVDFGEESS